MIVNGVADLTNRARTTVAVSLAVIVALSLVQLTGASLQFAYASSATQPSFQITPSTQTIVEGDYAKFDIDVSQTGLANVFLVARGLPANSNAIFAPQAGTANPEFHSTLSIMTSTLSPAGSYNITIIALVNGEEYPAPINLELTPSTTNQTSTVTSTGLSLSLSVDTDLNEYEPNTTVTVSGYVSDTSGQVVGGAVVSVQVDDPTGTQLVFVNNLTTDNAGIYESKVWLGPGATSGTYSVFVSSSKSGYESATTHTTFVVGSSLTPSVVISQVYLTDTAGNPSGVFLVGQTILVWVILQNNGAPFQGVIWVQILDPNGTPRSIQLQVSTLGTGASVKVGFGFTASANLPRGIYAANALVSDKLISQGGTFLTSAKVQFALTG